MRAPLLGLAKFIYFMESFKRPALPIVFYLLIFKFNFMNECNFSLSCHSFFSFLRVDKCPVK